MGGSDWCGCSLYRWQEESFCFHFAYAWEHTRVEMGISFPEGLGGCTLHSQLLRGLVRGFGHTIRMTSNRNNCSLLVNPGWAHMALILVSQGSPENAYTAQDMGSRTLLGNLSCCCFNHATAAPKRKSVRRLLREFCQLLINLLTCTFSSPI